MAYLGIDVGSLFAGLVLVDESGEVLRREHHRHHGEPVETVRAALSDWPESERAAIRNVVRTGSGAGTLPVEGELVDPVVAGVEAVKRLVPGARNIIAIGGGSFSLTRLDGQGRYLRSTINSACASGTGAFLDQQALRLQIPPHELADRAMTYAKRPPAVATRCAVFAKSDMIHLQQEGFSVEAIAAGLCAGLGNSTVDGLLGGHRLRGKTAVVGGVARNRVVIQAVREKLGVAVEVPETPESAGAYGAALIAMQRGDGARLDLSRFAAPAGEEAGARRGGYLRQPLALELSTYPEFTWADHWLDEEQSEIAVITPRRGTVPVSLGIDIGSTSTKAALLDTEDRVVGWIYRKTAGDPIGAVQKLVRALRRLQARGGFTLDIRGVGTTGSGRKLIRAVVGADLAMNEITAHARAAVFLDPEVDTIIELGGQDAKFTQLQNGMVYNSVMNYVCAAGTGSFIEEQALKLGIPLTEYADRAMGKPCPKTSDRCTVYMERDLDLLLAKGWSRDEVAAAVLHSVRDNYLNKVVGGLHIGEHVYFQGATARNRALVAAFETELGSPIQVSPFCHVTGALGMCLLVRERASAGTSAFRGLDFADETVTVEYETCELCNNLCMLSLIHAGEETVAWGMKCGRDYGATRVRVKRIDGYDYWKAREAAWQAPATPAGSAPRPRVGVLRSLGTYGTWPYWKAFLAALGCEPVLSPRSSEKLLHMGTEVATAEYCAPVLMSHGHARWMLEKESVDYLFVPHLVRAEDPHGFTDSHYCCYVQAHPSVLDSVKGLDFGEKLLAPVVEWNRPLRKQVERLHAALGSPLGVTPEAVAAACAAGASAQATFEEEARHQGTRALASLEERNALGIVCVGRPYNTVDPGMALDLPRKMAEFGYTVLYMDMLPQDLAAILGEHRNMYWHYGQRILAAAETIARHPRLFGVYFTNFMCGPDSYIQTYFKERMGREGKPYLCLQFDGHGADAGYLTRVEAALESFHAWSGIPRPAEPAGTGTNVAAPAGV